MVDAFDLSGPGGRVVTVAILRIRGSDSRSLSMRVSLPTPLGPENTTMSGATSAGSQGFQVFPESGV